MKIKSWLYISALLLIVGGGCTSKQDNSDIPVRNLETLSKDVQISSKAWELLEFRDKNYPDSIAPVLSEISVILTEKNKSVLKTAKLRISLPKGGGEIDLDDYIGAVPGTYFVNFEFPAFAGAKDQRVLFQSNMPTVTLDRKSFGAGCGNLSDISSKMLAMQGADGIQVNTTGDRDLYVLGGTFLFAAVVDSEIQIAQVTFNDKQREHLSCGGH